LKKEISFILIFLLCDLTDLNSQTTYSISTDLSAIRSQKKNQQFWGAGHTIKAELHFAQKDGAYAWFSYFIPGKFKNNLTATARSPATLPQVIAFKNSAGMSIKQLSIGWKHYFKGGCNADTDPKTIGWNFYGSGGFGVMGGKVNNNFSAAIDTALYAVPLLNGESRFKRLTVDLAAGCEYPLNSIVSIYSELKAWIPASDYPSKYLLVNDNAPLILSFTFGLRIYFD
jgi:hypothetical protein